MNYLHWDSLGKHFYLVDTFRGLNERFISTEDKLGKGSHPRYHRYVLPRVERADLPSRPNAGKLPMGYLVAF